MMLQDILFIISTVFFVIAGISIVTAVAVFFLRNVPDVYADLTGKKRAAAVAEIAAQRPGRDRRKGVARVEPTSGGLDSGSLHQVPHVESVSSDPEPAPASAAPEPIVSKPVGPSDDSATVVLPDDDQSTTILGAEEEEETAILTEEMATEVEFEQEGTDAMGSVGASSSSPAEQDAAPEPASDDSATTILPSDDSATTILPSDDSTPTADAVELADAMGSVGASSSSPAEQGEATESPEPTIDDATPLEPETEAELDGTEEVLPEHSAVQEPEIPVAFQPRRSYETVTVDDSTTIILPTEGAPAAPEGFVIVRKIVLRDSENIITAG